MSTTPAGRGRHTSAPTLRRRPSWLLPVAGLATVLLVLALTFVNQRANPSGLVPVSTLTTRDFHALVFSPSEPQTVFFGHHDGILISRDAGVRWQPSSLSGADAMSLVTSLANPQRLYAAGHGVLMRSDDGGATWSSVPGPLAGADIHGFAASMDDANRVYALVVGEGLLASSDGGASWQPLPNTPVSDITALAGGAGTTLFVGDARGTVSRSDDGGLTWQSGSIGAGMQVTSLAFDTRAGAVYAGAVMTGMNHGMLHRLPADASVWETLPFSGAGIPMAVAVSPHDERTLLLVNERGSVYRSQDAGATWRP
jgi:photosystem II stability/assembly factor-like uncharacterized protein